MDHFEASVIQDNTIPPTDSTGGIQATSGLVYMNINLPYHFSSHPNAPSYLDFTIPVTDNGDAVTSFTYSLDIHNVEDPLHYSVNITSDSVSILGDVTQFSFLHSTQDTITIQANEDTPITFEIIADDPDGFTLNDTLFSHATIESVTGTELGTNLSIQSDSVYASAYGTHTSRTITLKHNTGANHHGSDTVMIGIEDRFGQAYHIPIIIDVLPVNDAGTFAHDFPLNYETGAERQRMEGTWPAVNATIQSGETLSFHLSAVDIDNSGSNWLQAGQPRLTRLQESVQNCTVSIQELAGHPDSLTILVDPDEDFIGTAIVEIPFQDLDGTTNTFVLHAAVEGDQSNASMAVDITFDEDNLGITEGQDAPVLFTVGLSDEDGIFPPSGGPTGEGPLGESWDGQKQNNPWNRYNHNKNTKTMGETVHNTNHPKTK
jgi:hypothetical protein